MSVHRLREGVIPRGLPSMTMRFVQYIRKGTDEERIAVSSEDGERLIPFSFGSVLSKDIISSITNLIEIGELWRNVEFEHHNIDENITIKEPTYNPGKIICIGNNYFDYCWKEKIPKPPVPIFFHKHVKSIIGPTEDIISHKICSKIDWGVELAVIIGKPARNVKKDEIDEYIFGYTIAQSIADRFWDHRNNSGLLAFDKSVEGYCPLGPAIAHKSIISNPHDLFLSTKVNGKLKQYGNTKNMIYKIPDIIYELSKRIMLSPGDIVLTGTPLGTALHSDPPEFLKPGDVVESEIESLGSLINRVVRHDEKLHFEK